MRPPSWFKVHLAAIGGRVLEHAITEEQAAEDLTDQTFAREGGRFARDIVREYARKQIKNWLASHRVSGATTDDGQTDLFPEIPRKLEVAPGRFVDQAFMTRRDWAAAVRQAETKASNANGHAEAVKRIADKVVPLLTSDDQTTGEVWSLVARAVGES